MGFERYLHLIGQWLVNHGFQPNNRELASLTWLAVLAIFGIAVIRSGPHQQLTDILKDAFLSRLAYIWLTYILWIWSFVLLADHFGYWRPKLTKATVVWAATAGIGTLAGFNEAESLGYFKSTASNLLRLVVVFEYFLGIASFSFFAELFLQFIIAIVWVAPLIKTDYQQQWKQIRLGFFVVLLLALTINSGLAVASSWTTLNLGLILREISLPVILGVWVLLLVPILSIYTGYEVVFGQMEIFRNKQSGLWKAKLGVLLALRHHLRYIREAEKGGTEITRAARADTVWAAYREARKLVDE